MARLNTNAEVVAEVTEVGIMDDVSGGGSGTITTSPSAGGRSFDINSATNWTTGDDFRIGDRPNIESGNIELLATLTVTTKSDLTDAYTSGEAIVQVADVPIGDIEEGGIRILVEGGDTAIRSGSQRGIYVFIPSGNEQISFEFGLLNLSLENWAESVGLDPAAAIAGAGTGVDPYTLTVREDLNAAQPERVWYFQGLRLDAQIVRVEAFAAKIFSPVTTMTFTQGEATVLPFLLRVLHGYRVSLNT